MEILIYLMLGLTSVVGLAFIVERALALRWTKVVPPQIADALAACKTRDHVIVLRRACDKKPSPLGRLLLLAADHLDWPKEENVDALQTAARHEIVRLERGLVVLEVIVGIAPLLGLVGTIAGMMTVFGGLGQTGLNDAAKLAEGIALILRATLIGLLIAIPSLIAWSYYSKKVEVLAVEMEALCDDFIRRQYRIASPAVPAPVSHVPVPASHTPDCESHSAPDAQPQRPASSKSSVISNQTPPPPLPGKIQSRFSDAGHKSAVQAAKLSLWTPVIVIPVNIVVVMLFTAAHFGGVLGSLVQILIITLVLTVGLWWGCSALLAVRRYGRPGIWGRALAGVIINGLFLVICCYVLFRGIQKLF